MTQEKLTKIREEKNLTKGEFAKLLGISAMLLGKYEKGSCKIPESIAEKLEALADDAAATEIEVKKTVRKSARSVEETVEAAAGDDAVVATEIEVKKAAAKASREAEEAIKNVEETAKRSAKKIAGIPNIFIQSLAGGCITPEEIIKKVPKKTSDVYVKVEENKLYYVLENGETGDVDIWE